MFYYVSSSRSGFRRLPSHYHVNFRDDTVVICEMSFHDLMLESSYFELKMFKTLFSREKKYDVRSVP